MIGIKSIGIKEISYGIHFDPNVSAFLHTVRTTNCSDKPKHPQQVCLSWIFR